MTGGCICVSGVAALRDGSQVLAKTLAEPESDMFSVEVEGLSALRELGGVRVPSVVYASPQLLVLKALRPCGAGVLFWKRFAHMVAGLHSSTSTDRFSWHRDGRHGRLRQVSAPPCGFEAVLRGLRRNRPPFSRLARSGTVTAHFGLVQRGRARYRHLGCRGPHPRIDRTISPPHLSDGCT
ncbi:fructosamine kinase family protein [Nocardia otitidiscaviarum]